MVHFMKVKVPLESNFRDIYGTHDTGQYKYKK